jgi:hypothetical protein
MKYFIVALIFIGRPLIAQEIYGEIELAGFILGQQRAAVHRELGPPIETRITEDQWIYEFHKIKPDTSVYGLFKYPKEDTTRLYSIQVNGDLYDEMHPFYGFKLGAKKETAEQQLGKYDKVENITDPPLTIHYYLNKNYSIEIDETNKVTGIQIFGNIERRMPKESIPSIHAFQHAISAKNADSLLIYLAPDIVLHKGGKKFTYYGAARKEFTKDTEFTKLLLAPENSLWFVFAKEFAEGKPETKILPDGKIIHLQKFFDSNVISEITFTPHAGKWKVAEVFFR